MDDFDLDALFDSVGAQVLGECTCPFYLRNETGACRARPLGPRPQECKGCGDWDDAQAMQDGTFDARPGLRQLEEEMAAYFRAKNTHRKPVTDRRRKYDAYLSSPAWQVKRAQVMIRACGSCERCKKATAQHVHHLHYTHFGSELLEDLQALCKSCHEAMHGRRFG